MRVHMYLHLSKALLSHRSHVLDSSQINNKLIFISDKYISLYVFLYLSTSYIPTVSRTPAMLNMFMLTVCQENRSIWRRNVCFPCGGIAGGGSRKVWRQGWLMRMFSKWLSMSFVSPCLAYQLRNLHYVELLVSRPPSTSSYRWHWVCKECAMGDL